MNFRVIYKKGSEKVVADSINAIAEAKLKKAFMVVALERVTYGDIYLALHSKSTQVILCRNTGVEKVEAESIYDALQDEPPVPPIDTQIVDSTIVDSSVVDSTIVDTEIVDSTIVDTTIVDTEIVTPTGV